MKAYKVKDSNPIDSFQEPMANYGTSSLYQLSARMITKRYIKKVLSFAQLSVSELIDIIPISIDSYKRKNEFNPSVTEKILEIEEVYRRGTEAFGDRFHKWMNTENLAMGGKAPKSFLKNSFGIRMLIDEIGRLEHGILA